AIPLLGIDPKEAFIQPGQGAGGNAGAIVTYIHPHPVALSLNPHPDLALWLGVAQRIVDQVAEQQLEEDGLPHHQLRQFTLQR
ncbi:hypothetical protein OFN18_32280, partial [Escherichia coli]|nr:hypothetical protein [Escherichia coli]